MFGATSSKKMSGALALLVMASVGCGTSVGNQPVATNPGSFSSNEPVAGPLIGYVWDRSATGLRPVLGVSGAASLGSALYADGSYSGAVASLRRRYALLTNTEGQIVLTTLPNGEPAKLLNQFSARQQTALSPSGNAALIYAPDRGTVILLQGLPGKPNLQTINLPATGADQAVVGDTGLMLIATTGPDGTSAVRSLAPSGSSAPIATAGRLAALAFVPRSNSALIADAAQNAVLLASGLGATPGVSQVAGSADGIAQPIAVAASSDGRWGVVVNRQASTIVKVDLTHRAPSSQVQCGCSPAGLWSLAGNSVFLLTAPGAESMPVFDGDAVKPRIVFIPGVQQTRGMIR